MTTFADRIKKAATDFPGAHSTAWVQYLVGSDGRTVNVRMQAPEIMKEFRGSVKFGTGRSNCNPHTASSFCSLLPDPKGLLFFFSRDDLDINGNIKVRNARYNVSGSKVVVETEFGSPGGQTFEAFARVCFLRLLRLAWKS
jgi:hypothetical protein